MFWRVTKKEEAARRSSQMEGRDHSNAANPKSLMSRGNFLIALVLSTFMLPVFGEQVDENTALKVATQFLSYPTGTHSADSESSLKAQSVPQKTVQLLYKSSSNSRSANAKQTTGVNNEIVYFYVFCAEDKKGFVIVAGDDRVVPVLGYSHNNSFPAENIPPNLKWWLGEYARQIGFAIENNIEPTPETKQRWAKFFNSNNNEKEE